MSFALNLTLKIIAHENLECVVCGPVRKSFVLIEPRTISTSKPLFYPGYLPTKVSVKAVTSNSHGMTCTSGLVKL